MDALTEAQVLHDIQLNKLSVGYANEFDLIQPEILKAVRLAFSEFEEVNTVALKNELNARIEELVLPILLTFIESQNLSIEELAELEVEWQDAFFSGFIGGFTATAVTHAINRAKVKYRTAVVTTGQFGQTVNIAKELNALPKSSVDAMKSIIANGLDGVSIDEIRKQITGTKANNNQDGLIAKINRDIKSTIITARKHQEIEAKTQAYKAAKTDGYVLSAVLDGRTSDICLGYNGRIVLWSYSFQPMPPFHYRCRTTMLPYIKGRTIAPGNGFAWLKSQSAQFQDDLIGVTRGKILRNSGLTADEYRRASRNNLNEPITLDEMKVKNKQIKEYLSKLEQGV